MSSCFSFHRFASISGSPDDVKLAEILIYQMIANQPKLEQIDIFVRAIYIGTYSTTLKWLNFTITFFYHFTGRIIGRNGEVIRSIQDRSRCKIKVERGQTFDGKYFTFEYNNI